MTAGLIIATVVSQATIAKSQAPVQIALFKSDGTPYPIITKMPLQADTVAADLAALKVDFNLLLGKLKTAGLMSTT